MLPAPQTLLAWILLPLTSLPSPRQKQRSWPGVFVLPAPFLLHSPPCGILPSFPGPANLPLLLPPACPTQCLILWSPGGRGKSPGLPVITFPLSQSTKTKGPRHQPEATSTPSFVPELMSSLPPTPYLDLASLWVGLTLPRKERRCCEVNQRRAC